MNWSDRLTVAVLLVGLLLPAVAAAETVVERDRQRIRQHLKQVEQQLRARDVSHLSADQRRARRANLDRLNDYWKAGVFPQNNVTDERTPVFIDDDGRECAVGYLMVESGWEEEARAISERENLKRLPDMTSPEVAAWVKQSGLTVEEATLIQPSYSPCQQCDCVADPVCGDDGKTYVNECTATKCGDAKATNEGCCMPSDDPITPRETDDSFATCGEIQDDGHNADAGTDAGNSSGGVCEMTPATDTPPTPATRACSLAGDRQSPLRIGWVVLVLAGVLGLRRRLPFGGADR